MSSSTVPRALLQWDDCLLLISELLCCEETYSLALVLFVGCFFFFLARKQPFNLMVFFVKYWAEKDERLS